MKDANFPPLYTLQPSARLRDAYISKWTYILFENARKSKNNVVDASSSVFANKKIGRRAEPKLIAEIFHVLCAKNLCRQAAAKKDKYELQLLSVQEAVKEISRLVFEKGLLDELLDFDDVVDLVRASPVEPMGSDFLVSVLAQMASSRSVEKYSIDGVDSYKFKLLK